MTKITPKTMQQASKQWHVDPTPQQIAAETAKIRAGWSNQERRTRRTYMPDDTNDYESDEIESDSDQ